MFHAANDRYPKDLNEFMTEIIKANNISLPKLPCLSGLRLRREGAQTHHYRAHRPKIIRAVVGIEHAKCG